MYETYALITVYLLHKHTIINIIFIFYIIIYYRTILLLLLKVHESLFYVIIRRTIKLRSTVCTNVRSLSKNEFFKRKKMRSSFRRNVYLTNFNRQ